MEVRIEEYDLVFHIIEGLYVENIMRMIMKKGVRQAEVGHSACMKEIRDVDIQKLEEIKTERKEK